MAEDEQEDSDIDMLNELEDFSEPENGDISRNSDSFESTSSSRSEMIQEQNELMKKKTVCIVVLGDIGRSPRMRYHAASLAREGYLVQMVGYGGTTIPDELTSNPAIWFRFMREPPACIQNFPRLIAYPLKIVFQWFILSWAFLVLTFMYQFRPDFILLQNPPAIPTIPLCWCYSKIYRCPFIIDWHNYGYSIMAMKTGKRSLILTVAKWLEDYFGKRADRHICVTRAMKDDLKERLGVDAVTLYDRAPAKFKSFSEDERFEFLSQLSTKYFKYPELQRVITPKPNEIKPGILVSTTSWTEDEDFRILLSALKDYDALTTLNPSSYPTLLVFITGKGPEKKYYQDIIEKMKVPNVKFYLPWLDFDDYPKLLASADLGVSLHTSSSGLDLPMKVVDMFGAGLPVCAMNFKCISELVRHNENGLLFDNASELATQLQDWFKVSKDNQPNKNHKRFRENVKSFQSIRWHENWLFNAAPIFE